MKMSLNFLKRIPLSTSNSVNVETLWRCGLIAVVMPMVCVVVAILALVSILSNLILRKRTKNEITGESDWRDSLSESEYTAYRVYYGEPDTLPRSLRDQILMQMEEEEWYTGLTESKTLH